MKIVLRKVYYFISKINYKYFIIAPKKSLIERIDNLSDKLDTLDNSKNSSNTNKILPTISGFSTIDFLNDPGNLLSTNKKNFSKKKKY